MHGARNAVVIVYAAIIVVVQVLQYAVRILQRIRELQVDVARIRTRIGVTRNWHREHRHRNVVNSTAFR